MTSSVSGSEIVRSSRPDLAPFFDASPFATLLFTPDLILIDSNAAHARLSGILSERLRGRPMFEVFPKNEAAIADGAPDTEAIIRASVARTIETGAPDETPVQRHDLPREDETFDRRYWRMIHSPVRDGDRVVAIRQDAWDVTESELRTERQAALQRIAGTVSGIAFWQQDVTTNKMLRTPELDAIYGLPAITPDAAAKPVDGAIYQERVPVEDQKKIAATIADLIAAGAGAVRQVEHRVRRPDGNERTVAVRCELTQSDADRPMIVGTSLDVTDLHANERRLEALLAEKEVLLDEVNHRVKNSLQLVSSILSLEGRAAPEGERARLASASARVRAVADVHASFYHDDDVRSIEFGSHLRAFCERLADSLGADAQGIELSVQAEAISLSAERAVPLSLIVNELVTNAFKYAFPDRTAGSGAGLSRVEVWFGRHDPSRLRLVVTDNGRGSGTEPSAGASFHNTVVVASGSGLGTKLISTLVRQIGGEMSVETGTGWTTTITFDL